MKKTFLMTAAAVAIFAVACEKDEINALNNDLNTLASVSAAGDKANADALAVESARLQSIIDLNKIAQEEGDDAIRAAIEAHVAAIEASIIEASEEAAANLASARAEVLELLAAAQAEINVRLEDLASVDVELAEADADLQDALDTAQANLDSAIADLEAADESNLAAALDAVAVARAAAEAAISDVELEGGKDGLSEEAVQELIDEATDGLVNADDIQAAIDGLNLDFETEADVQAAIDAAILSLDVQGKIDSAVDGLQSEQEVADAIAALDLGLTDAEIQALVDAEIAKLTFLTEAEIEVLIQAAVVDLAADSDLEAINAAIAELKAIPADDDSAILAAIAKLEAQVIQLSGIDYYSEGPWSPDFTNQTENFSQSRTVSLVIVGAVDANPPAALDVTQTIIVSSSTSTDNVLSADVPEDQQHGDDDGDGLNKYVKTTTTYSAEGFDNTHEVITYGSYEDADAAIIPVDPTDVFVPGAYGPAFTNQIVNFEQSRTGTVSVVGDEDAIAPTDDAPTRTVVVTNDGGTSETISSTDALGTLPAEDDGDGLNNWLETATVYTADIGGTHTVYSYSAYVDNDASEVVFTPGTVTVSGYDAAWLITSVTDADGNAVTFSGKTFTSTVAGDYIIAGFSFNVGVTSDTETIGSGDVAVTVGN